MQDAHMAVVIANLSESRFKTYLDLCEQDRHQALGLYRWNLQAAGALHEALAVAEVCLRNAIDTQLREWNQDQPDRTSGLVTTVYGANWAEQPAAPLFVILNRKDRHGTWRSDYADAHARAVSDQAGRLATHRRHGHPVDHDDVVAHMTFGTWKKMLPRRRSDGTFDLRSAQWRLWEASLSRAFPGHPNPAPIGYWVNRLHLIRNRVAHLEPLVDLDILSYHRTTSRLLGAVDPRLSEWFGGISRIPEIARATPPR